jgi:hypothetical protein
MKMDIKRIDLWVAGIKDQPGGLAEKLSCLTEAGASLTFLLARRTPDQPGKVVVFVAPVQGTRQTKAAKQVGFHKSKSICGVRVVTGDKRGLGMVLTKALADSGINLRGFSGVAVGKRAVFHIALDTASDAAKATKILKKVVAV